MQVSSQHPYAEDFIGLPHVYTIDIDNATEVQIAVKKAIAAVDAGEVGHIEHVTTYTHNQLPHSCRGVRLGLFVCLSVGRATKQLLLRFTFYTRNIIPMARSSSKMIWIWTQKCIKGFFTIEK